MTKDEALKPTQVPEQIAKYVAALVQGTHEITSVTIRPKREWVGLTDKEIDAALKSCNTTDTYKYFRAIEAKLKELNS